MQMVVMSGDLVKEEFAKNVCIGHLGAYPDLDNTEFLTKAITAMQECSSEGQYHWFNSLTRVNENKCYAIDRTGSIVEKDCRSRLPVICVIPAGQK